MAKDNELIIKIGAKSKDFRDELDKVKRKTKDLEVGLTKVAKVSTLAFVGLAAAVGTTVVKFSNFEKKFTNVVTLLDKGSFKTKEFTKGVNDLKDGVLKLGATSGESFENLNQGLFDIVSAGIDAEQSINVLTTATELAVAGATDTSVAVDGLTSAINAYGLEAGDAASIAQKFFLAQKAGKTTVAQLSSGFGLVASTAKEFGVSLDELLASVSAASLGGIRTRAAYTGLNAVLANISQPTKDAAAEAKRLGIEFNSTAIRSLGFKGFLDSITSSAKFNKTSLEKLFGSIEAKKFVFAIAGSKAKEFAEQLENLADKTKLSNTFQDALATKQKTTEKALARLRQSANALAITFGEAFAPTINKVADGLANLAQKFSSLDKETVQTIATLTKWVGGLLAAIATMATVAVGVLKLQAVLAGLGVLFPTLAAGAATFWAALLGPVGLFIAGAAAVTVGIAAMYGAFEKAPDLNTLDGINRKLKLLKDQQEGIIDGIVQETIRDDEKTKAKLDNIDKEIKKLEELRKKKEQVATPVGLGVLTEFKSTGDPLDGFNQDIDQVQPVQEPISPIDRAAESARVAAAARAVIEETARKEREKQAKEEADRKAQILSDEQDKRIEKLKEDTAKRRELRDAEQAEFTEKEQEFLSRRIDLENAFDDARKEKNNELRGAELENLQLKHEELLAEEALYNEKKAEQEALNQEQSDILKAELAQLDAQTRAKLTEAEIKELQATVKTREQIAREEAKNKAAATLKEREVFIKDEMAHGTAFAKIKEAFNTKEVQGVRNAGMQLAQLQNSKNKTMKAIGKKAAQVNIAIDTARGAMAAYSSLAAIPLVGPALGAAAAGLVIAYGAERIADVNSAKRGGFVPQGNGGSADRVPMMLEPNELVVPKDLAPNFIQSIGNPNVDEAGDSGNIGSGNAAVYNFNITGDVIGEDTYVENKLIPAIRNAVEFSNADLGVA